MAVPRADIATCTVHLALCWSHCLDNGGPLNQLSACSQWSAGPVARVVGCHFCLLGARLCLWSCSGAAGNTGVVTLGWLVGVLSVLPHLVDLTPLTQL